MIINAQQSNVQTYGDIKEFKTSIDPKNLEFITTLLSSNLYSDPEQSFIREIVSNAWDSHVEAGTTDIPVLIRLLDKGWGDRSITIRDYGTGLSPERFKEVYCNIGSSTKRDTNAYIGGFGIGKYSSLACSNTVYITSYYEGTAYYYLMVKSGNAITTNLLMEKPTTEKNGVEITIKNLNDLDKYVKALKYIVFFPNIYVDGAGSDINSTKLKFFTNFAAASKTISSKLLLGNVLYPCNVSHFGVEVSDFLFDIRNTGIVIRFEVGELNITPNRESIIYTSDTIKKIEERVLAAKKELHEMIGVKLMKDYDDIAKYYSAVSERQFYDPIKDTLDYNSCYNYPVRIRNEALNKITYNNISFSNEELSAMGMLLSVKPINMKGIVYEGKILKKANRYYRSGHRLDSFGAEKVLILNKGARLTEPVKKYLRDYWDNYTVLSDFTLEEMSSYIKGECNTTNIDEKRADLIIDGIYESIKKRAEKVDINTDKTYLEVKESMSKKNNALTAKRDILLRMSRGSHYLNRMNFDTLEAAVRYIKNLKSGIILTTMEAPDPIMAGLASWKGYVYIKVKKDIAKDIRSLGLKCVVDLDWVTKKDPMLSKVSAILKNFPEGIDTSTVYEIIPTIDERLGEEFMEIVRMGAKSNIEGVRAVAIEVEPDPYTDSMCKTLKKYIGKYKYARDIVGINVNVYNKGVQSEALIAGVILKTKAYRLGYKAYKKYKHNDLIKILCKK